MNATVLEAIKKSAAVPSMPQVVSRFLDIMQDPNYGYGELVKVLSVDPGTVSEILRLANSALFGIRNKIVSLRQALTLLGPARTRSLVLGRYLVDSLSSKQVSVLDMSYFWRRSVTGAVVASRLAERLLPRQRNDAFIAALLADVGVPILAEAFPDRYGAVVASYCPHGAAMTPQRERKAVGVTHGEVSAMVLSHWNLPDSVTGAVNLQHSETPGNDPVGTLARILNSSDRIAKMLCEVADGDTALSECADVAEFARVELGALAELLTTIESDIEELAKALRIDVHSSKIYAILAKRLQAELSARAVS